MRLRSATSTPATRSTSAIAAGPNASGTTRRCSCSVSLYPREDTMPEVHFEVRWPSGLTRRYYSPSTIVHQHLKTGTSYDVKEFVARTETAMNAASERVRAKFGYT